MTDKENITEYSSELLGERYFKVRHKSGLDVYVYPKDMVTSYALFATRYGAFDDKFRKGGANGQMLAFFPSVRKAVAWHSYGGEGLLDIVGKAIGNIDTEKR